MLFTWINSFTDSSQNHLGVAVLPHIKDLRSSAQVHARVWSGWPTPIRADHQAWPGLAGERGRGRLAGQPTSPPTRLASGSMRHSDSLFSGLAFIYIDEEHRTQEGEVTAQDLTL